MTENTVPSSSEETKKVESNGYLPDDSIHTRYLYAFFADNDKHIVTAPFDEDPNKRLLFPGNWGLIDYKGNEIVDGKNIWIEPSFDKWGYMEFPNPDGYVVFGKKEKGMGVAKITDKFEEILPPKYEELKLFGKYAVIPNKKNQQDIIFLPSKKKIGSISSNINIQNIGENKILCRDKTTQSLYILDPSGKTIISSEKLKEYIEIYPFSEGLAMVSSRNNEKIGFIEENGKLVIPIKYDFKEYLPLPSFKKGLAIVEHNGKMGAIDRKGRTVIPFKYDELIVKDDTFIGTTYNDSGKRGTSMRINNKGKETGKYTPTHPSDEWETYYTYKENAYGNQALDLEGYKDKNGRIMLPAKYRYCSQFKNGYAIVFLGNHVVMIDSKGKVILDSLALRNQHMLPG
ncbi:MAG: WG repeat-containing protein [Muribaculaceae bacterium]|nr:WG repeat-containing protein [Muribaculaceae bacterium]